MEELYRYHCKIIMFLALHRVQGNIAEIVLKCK